MRSNGGSSDFACLKCGLKAEWTGSLQSFVSQCKPLKWGSVWGNGGYVRRIRCKRNKRMGRNLGKEEKGLKD